MCEFEQHEIVTPTRRSALLPVVCRKPSGRGKQEFHAALWPGPCASVGVHLRRVQVEKTTGGGERVSARRSVLVSSINFYNFDVQI